MQKKHKPNTITNVKSYKILVIIISFPCFTLCAWVISLFFRDEETIYSIVHGIAGPIVPFGVLLLMIVHTLVYKSVFHSSKGYAVWGVMQLIVHASIFVLWGLLLYNNAGYNEVVTASDKLIHKPKELLYVQNSAEGDKYIYSWNKSPEGDIYTLNVPSRTFSQARIVRSSVKTKVLRHKIESEKLELVTNFMNQFYEKNHDISLWYVLVFMGLVSMCYIIISLTSFYFFNWIFQFIFLVNTYGWCNIILNTIFNSQPLIGSIICLGIVGFVWIIMRVQYDSIQINKLFNKRNYENQSSKSVQ